jgi:hypothetical protein
MEHCDNKKELQEHLNTFPKIEGEHEKGYTLSEISMMIEEAKNFEKIVVIDYPHYGLMKI